MEDGFKKTAPNNKTYLKQDQMPNIKQLILVLTLLLSAFVKTTFGQSLKEIKFENKLSINKSTN